MTITNTELAQNLSDVSTGWKTFVTEVIGWGQSTQDTFTFTDPYTQTSQVVPTPYVLNNHVNDLAKLDTIETGATADQTGAEIKTLYEAELDTNCLTDALLSKLNAIEAGATGDLTGAEIKTLYEAELDTNPFNDTYKSKVDGIEAGATADQTGAEIKALYEAELDTNAFTDADHTKLDGIESGATADQTGAEIKALYEAVADTNVFDNAAMTKLAGIEAGATADQTKADIDALGIDAATLGGKSLSSSGDRWDVIPFVDVLGAMEIGKTLDFHDPDSDTGDYDVRIYTSLGSLFLDASAVELTNNLLIPATKKIGIGTTTPDAAIDIEGGEVAVLRLNDTRYAESWDLTGSTSFQLKDSGGVPKFTVGTSTSSFSTTLAISDQISVWDNTSSASIYVAKYSVTGNILLFEDLNEDPVFSVGNDGSLGIGTGTPGHSLHVIDNDGDKIGFDRHSTGTDGVTFEVQRSRGTAIAPTTLVSGDVLSERQFYGHNGTAWDLLGKELFSTQTVSGLNMSGKYELQLNDTAGNLQTRFVIDEDGQVGIGAASPDFKFHVVDQTGGKFGFERNSADAAGSNFDILKSRGSHTSKAAILSGDTISVWKFKGFDGTSYDNVCNLSVTAQSVSGGNMSGKLEYKLSDTSGILQTRFSIDEDGLTTINKLNISNLPTSATGLSAGDIWNDSGTLKVA